MTLRTYKLKFIQHFDSLFKNRYCWADCVSWAFSNKWNPFKIEKGCRSDKELCYCGRFYNGRATDEMTEEEIKTINK